MSVGRHLALVVGAAVGGAGLAFLAAPDLAPEFGASRVVAAAVAVAAFVGAGYVALARLAAGPEFAPLPDPEARPDYAVPGDSFERRLDDITARTEGDDARDAVRADLRDVAVAVLARDGLDSEAATAALADGTWTDDPAAAAFFTGEAAGTADHVRSARTGVTPFHRRARAVADELGRRLEANR